MKSTRCKVKIDSLLLDPNNYRFIDKNEYKEIPSERIGNLQVQSRTQSWLLGTNNANIKDLYFSFINNGFVDTDQIQVREKGDKYVVLEGNRRVATLKFLYEQFKKDPNSVGKLKDEDFNNINVAKVMNQNPAEHLIFMGLNHISGKKKWSPVNESQLIEDLITKHKKDEEWVCNSLGINKHRLRKSRRTLALINEYKDSDYGDQFRVGMFSIFETVMNSSNMKAWIGWDDKKMESLNISNLERFFSWISESQINEEAPYENTGEEFITRTIEPFIVHSKEIRVLAKFIQDEKAVDLMEREASVVVGETHHIRKDKTQTIKSAILGIQRDLNDLDAYKKEVFPKYINEIQQMKQRIDLLYRTNEVKMVLWEQKRFSSFEQVSSHFTSLNILEYRVLKNVEVLNLSKVNVFVGRNNSGKTSLLEAVYLFSQTNDLNVLINLESYRGWLGDRLNSKVIEKTIVNQISVKGIFNGVKSSLAIKKGQTKRNIINRTGYLNSIESNVRIGKNFLTSYMDLYDLQETVSNSEGMSKLCPAIFTSPYRDNRKILKKAYTYAIEESKFSSIIDFIKHNFDPSIDGIALVPTSDEVGRFVVSSSRFDKTRDITEYGEGLQRVFTIALLIVYCQDGIIAIDEVESAIDKNVLVEFIKFIYKLSCKFNVQLFLSTHSKECVDAFALCEDINSNLTFYNIKKNDDEIRCEFIEGNRLKTLIEEMGFDVRK